MACVFGQMRTLKTGSRWSPKSVPFRKDAFWTDRFPGIAARRAKCVVITSAAVRE